MLRRRKFIITNENNRSFESLQTDEKTGNKKNNTLNDLKTINNNGNINSIIDVCEYGNKINLTDKHINLTFKTINNNTEYKCNNYEKYKPYNYTITDKKNINGLSNKLSDKITASFTRGIFDIIVGQFAASKNSYNQIANDCLDVFKEIKNIFK